MNKIYLTKKFSINLDPLFFLSTKTQACIIPHKLSWFQDTEECVHVKAIEGDDMNLNVNLNKELVKLKRQN